MLVRIQQRRGTSSEWTASNPVLADGEIGIETDTDKYKIGDGASPWSTLPYNVNLSYIAANYIPIIAAGMPSGLATLDQNGRVPLSQLENIIDGAPALLNTLNEIAAAIDDNAAFVDTIEGMIDLKAPKASPSFTGTVNFSGATSIIGISQMPVPLTTDNNKFLYTDGLQASWLELKLDTVKDVDLSAQTPLADGDVLSYNGTTQKWTNFPPSSLVGPEGPVGPAISIMGVFQTYGQLIGTITSPNKGDAYVVANDLYSWTGNAWVNAGPIFGGAFGISPLFFAGW